MIEIELVLAGTRWPIQRTAYIVPDIAPHLASYATFAVHRMLDGWRVSNVETGGAVKGSDAKTMQESVAAGRRVLQTKSVGQLRAAYMRVAKMERRLEWIRE